MNLLTETKDEIKSYGKSIEGIKFINSPSSTSGVISWEEFVKECEEFKDYDSGYGSQEVPNYEIVFNDNTWLSRFEYDGSENWELNSIPMPLKTKAIRKEEAAKRFAEWEAKYNV